MKVAIRIILKVKVQILEIDFLKYRYPRYERDKRVTCIYVYV